MKTKLILFIFLLSFSSFCYGQFPPPQNFHFEYDYIRIDQMGICDGEKVDGPTYCSYFSWNEPKSDKKPIEYKLYCKWYYFFENLSDTIINVIAKTQNTFYIMNAGIIGEVWVTAVYEDPNGESEPSNVEINTNLPISINDVKENDDNIHYDNTVGRIIIDDNNNIKCLTIIDGKGHIVNRTESPQKEISINDYLPGLYLIKVEYINSEAKVIKIMK